MCVWVIARLPQRLKSTIFEFFFREEQPRRSHRNEKKFQKQLILVFEVIVQPPKHTFQITLFSEF